MPGISSPGYASSILKPVQIVPSRRSVQRLTPVQRSNFKVQRNKRLGSRLFQTFKVLRRFKVQGLKFKGAVNKWSQAEPKCVTLLSRAPSKLREQFRRAHQLQKLEVCRS